MKILILILIIFTSQVNIAQKPKDILEIKFIGRYMSINTFWQFLPNETRKEISGFNVTRVIKGRIKTDFIGVDLKEQNMKLKIGEKYTVIIKITKKRLKELKIDKENTFVTYDYPIRKKEIELIEILDDINNIHKSGKTLKDRFLVPKGYERVIVKDNSFADYLRKLPLKDHNSLVRYYNGTTKENNDIYDAVVDMKIGKKNLHQCADAIIHLRAEYFWKKASYDKIHFHFTNGFNVEYSRWMKGDRIVVEGNKTYWKNKTKASNSYNDFWNYLEIIFTYSGTLSLSKEMKYVDLKDMKIGDVFIIGGSPGHAVLVVDMAKNKDNKKIFMLAQSFMPAQEMQVLKNPKDPKLSPWYLLDIKDKLYTPEWTFSKTDLKRFKKEK